MVQWWRLSRSDIRNSTSSDSDGTANASPISALDRCGQHYERAKRDRRRWLTEVAATFVNTQNVGADETPRHQRRTPSMV